MMFQRITRSVERHVLWEHNGKVGFRHRDDAARRAIDDGNRATPIALAGYPPVTQPEVDGALANFGFFQAFGCCGLGVRHGHAVEKLGIDHPAIADIGFIGNGERIWIGSVRAHHRHDV